MPLFPRDDRYFELMSELVTRIHKGADLLAKLFDDIARKEDYFKQIKDLEHECDQISATIVERIDSSFVTPIDREDIYLLANELDDVMDRINDVALITVLHGVEKDTPPAHNLSRILRESVQELEPAVQALRTRKGVREHVQKIKKLEEDGDQVWQSTIRALFAEQKDAIELVRWMGIYDALEAALDQCKAVAKLLESIVVKNA